MKEKIRAAILGLGTVGTGVYKIIQNQKDEFPFKIGSELEVAKILVKNTKKHRDGIDMSLITNKWEDIINDDSIDIVILWITSLLHQFILIAELYTGRIRYTRPNIQYIHLFSSPIVYIMAYFWTRSNKTHIPHKNINQLRQLI